MFKKIYHSVITLMLGIMVFYSTSSFAACSGSVDPDSTFVVTLKNYAKDMSTEKDSCWFCPIFKKLVSAVNTIANSVFNDLASSFIDLLGIGILFVILFKVGKLVVSLQEVDLMQFLNDLFVPLGRAIFATALLTVLINGGNQTIFHLLTQPVFDISIKLSSKILESSLGSVEYIMSVENAQNGGEIKDTSFAATAKAEMQEASKNLDKEGIVAQVITDGEQGVLIAWMREVSSSFMVGMATGATLFKIGLPDWYTTTGISCIFSGGGIWFVFMLLYLMFPFKVIDAFVRLAFVLTLMPLWIVLWVFKATSKYTLKAWEMFLSSCLLLVVLGVMIGLVIPLVSNIFPGDNAEVKEIYNCLRSGQTEYVVEKLIPAGALFMNALAFGALSFMLLSAAAPIANTFAEAGGNLGVGDGMAALAARGAKTFVAKPAVSTAKKVGSAGVKAGKAIGGWALGKVTGGRFGRFGGGSGGGGSGGSGPTPTPIRGEKGDTGARGATGARGETGATGPQGVQGNAGKQGNPGENNRTPEVRPPEQQTSGTNGNNTATGGNQARPEETATNTNTQNRNGTSSTDARTQSGDSQAGNTGSSSLSTGNGASSTDARTQSGDSQAGNTATSSLSTGKREMVDALAGKNGSDRVMTGLAQDAAFIEQSLGMNSKDFKAAMASRFDARSDGDMMKRYADSLYRNKDNPTGFADASERMVKEKLNSEDMSSLKNIGGVDEIGKSVKTNIQTTGRSNLSNQLSEMATAISNKKAQGGVKNR